jgi:long-chain acyl-CoA synthetase
MYTWGPEIQNSITQQVVNGTSIRAYQNRPNNLIQALQKNVELYPKKEAIIAEGIRLSYEQFYHRILHVSNYLRDEIKLEQGDRVGLLLKNTVEFCVLTYAILAAGLVVVPLSTKLKTAEIENLVKNSKARAVFVESEEVQAELNAVLETAVIKADRSVILNQDRNGNLELAEPHEHDTAFIMYTSGTTGNPKGAMISHFNAIHAAMNYEKCYQLNPDDRTIIAVPIFHGTGLMAQLVTFLCLGGSIVLLEVFNTTNFLALCEQEQVTHSICVPTIYNLLLHEPGKENTRLSIRVLGSGGAPMSKELYNRILQWLPGCILLNTYGLTEATSPALMTPIEMAKDKVGSVGMASPIIDCKIVDLDTNQSLPPRQSGEIWIKGALITKGYWENEEATKNTITEGWLHTGDVGWMDEDGFIYVCDRIKDMINRGGEKIYSTEVEDVISSHPLVLEAAAVGVPDELYGEVVKAYVVPVQGKTIQIDEIVEWASARLAKYKVPKYIEIADTLPRNAGGKVLKRLLTAK